MPCKFQKQGEKFRLIKLYILNIDFKDFKNDNIALSLEGRYHVIYVEMYRYIGTGIGHFC